MSRYEIKYKRSAFFFETLSLFAIVFFVFFIVLAFNNGGQLLWRLCITAGFLFLVLKLVSRKIMSIKIEVMTEPTISLAPAKEQTQDSIMRINPARDELNYALGSPSTNIIKIMSKNEDQPNPTPSAAPAAKVIPQPTKRDKIPENSDIPLLTEQVAETQPTAAHAAGLSKSPAANRPPIRFQCAPLRGDANENDQAHAPAYAQLECEIGEEFFILRMPHANTKKKDLAKLKRTSISSISYEELREIDYKKFKFLKFLTLGVVAGFLIALWFITKQYYPFKTWPDPSYAITTVLPTLALSTLGGLVIGLLFPGRRVRVYALFSVNRRRGRAVHFIIPNRDLKRVSTLLASCNLAPTNVD